jgi:hypothetical protein
LVYYIFYKIKHITKNTYDECSFLNEHCCKEIKDYFSELKLKKCNDFDKNYFPSGQSFTNNESRQEVIIPEDLIKIIENNIIFQNLVKQFYNYDILQKLNDQNKINMKL